jgi:SPX domain protein involved in polyphosphate accumulation
MKYGEYLISQQASEWEEYYLNYEILNNMISRLEELHILSPSASTKGNICLSYC